MLIGCVPAAVCLLIPDRGFDGVVGFAVPVAYPKIAEEFVRLMPPPVHVVQFFQRVRESSTILGVGIVTWQR